MLNQLFQNASYMIDKPSFLFGNNAVLNVGHLLKQSNGPFAKQRQPWQQVADMG